MSHLYVVLFKKCIWEIISACVSFMFLIRFDFSLQESGISGLNSKTHLKLMLKWMRGRKMLKLFCNQIGSNKKFLLCTLPEDPQIAQFIKNSELKSQTEKPSIKRKRKQKK